MNRFESVTDGTASHSTWLPNDGNQVAGYKPLRWLMALLLVAFVAGCGNGGGGRDPILGGSLSGKSLAPTVTGVAPANNEFGVGTNLVIITADFSEPMAPITAANFTVICTAPLPCATQPTGSVALNAAKTRATFTITNSPLLGLTTYTATITGAKSLTTGIALVSPFIWHFTTGVGLDNIKPKVASTIPANAAVNVPANTQITATFNKDMAPATLGATSFTLTCAGTPVTSPTACVTASPAGTVSYVVGSKTAIFTLTPAGTLLEVGKTYTARITTAATDLANNPLAGGLADPNIAADYVWTFTTKPAVLPVQVWVVSTQPADAEVNVCPSATINATFSVPMDPLTITSANFSVTDVTASSVVIATSVGLDGTGKTATFTPNALLINGDTYTATIKGDPNAVGAGVKDLAIPANTMANDKVWTFTAGPATGACAPLVSSTLGILAPFGIASAAGVTNTPTTPLSHINGDVVFDPTATCSGVPILFADGPGFGACGGKAPTLTGIVVTPTYPNTTTSAPIKAKLNAVYLSIAAPMPGGNPGGTLAGATLLGCGTIGTGSPEVGPGFGCPGNTTLPAGVYKSKTSSTIDVTGVLTLDGGGNQNAQFVFQAPSALTTAAGAPGVPGSQIVLINGAKASNVWWQVGSSAVIGTYADFQGNILADTSITLGTSATSCGRLLAGAVTTSGAFTFDTNIVSVPGNPSAPALCK